MIIRLWAESGTPGWRARIMRTLDIREGAEVMASGSTVEDLCGAVTEWIAEFTAATGTD
jgi:hypothetical protein